jgi:hypothetical protein
MTLFNTFSVILRDEISALLAPLIAVAQQPGGVQLLLQAVGHTDALGSRPDLRAEIERLAALAQGLIGLGDDTLESWAGLAQVLDLARDLLTALHRLEHLMTDPALAEQCQDLGRDLVQHLLSLYLRTHHQTMFRAANLLTLITPLELTPPLPAVRSGTETARFPRRIDQFHPGRVADLLQRPLPTLAEHYFPNGLATAQDAHEAGQRLFPVLHLLAQALGLSSFSDIMRAIPELDSPLPSEGNDLDHFSGSEPGEEEDPVIHPPPEPVDLTAYYETFLPRFGFVLPGQQEADGSVTPARFALSALLSSARHPGGARGLVMTPLGQLNWSEVRSGWRLALESSGQVPAFVLGPGGISMAPTDSALSAATARLVVERVAEAGAPAFTVGAANGTRLEIGALRCTTDVRVAPSESAMVLAADALSGVLVLAPDNGDGFLQAILPEDGLRCAFDLGVELSTAYGLRLRGGAGFEATVPIGLSVGGVTVPTLHLGLRASAQGLTAEVSANARVSIGPVHAVIERVGLAAAVTFPDTGGNLGIGDLALGFKPPNGIGLAINAPQVVGGGYLFFDPQQGHYTGIAYLEINDLVSVKALGLLSTKLPGGAPGYSLLLIVTAEGFRPIPLGFGFRLTGVGGLLGVHRTANTAALQAGVRNRTLDAILFPKNLLANAPQYLSTLNTVFPPARDHFLVGLAAQITWGTPTLVTINLALILELGAATKLLILGQLSALLPSPQNDLVRLQMDAIGIIDFDQRTASLDARLYDSRLARQFAISGEMALRMRWGQQPSFALAVGGFHPAFTPPAGFPALKRATISLANSENLQIRCESYFAITSNTVQFGARAELLAKAGQAALHGELGYDVLIQFDPFHFIADFHASVQIRYRGRNLLRVALEGQLSGPRPLRVRGKATFEILWFDVSVSFDRTLVSGARPPAPAPVEVMPHLQEALRQPASWQAALPGARLVTLRESAAPGTVTLHPLSTLSVRQNVVPLNLRITRFGNTRPSGAQEFRIQRVALGGQPGVVQGEPLRDFFAPAQFREMSDDEQLSAPAFEALPAGVQFSSGSLRHGTAVVAPLDEYEEYIIPQPAHAPQSGQVQTTADLLTRFGHLSAVGSNAVRRTGRHKYQAKAIAVASTDPVYALTSTRDLTATTAQYATWTEASAALWHLRNTDPAQARDVQIVTV